MLDYSKIKVGIINLQINNIYSIYNVLKNIGYKVYIVKKKLENFDLIILPGVGSYKEGMKALTKNNLIESLKENIILKKKKIVGICLGMQLLFSESNEDGYTKGLNFIKGNVRKLKIKKKFSVPIIGWYKIKSEKKELNTKYFYHIHSYYCKPKNENLIVSTTEYNNFTYCSSIQEKNIIAFQFHPEKSGKNGINLLKKIPNFFE
jgi:glutamine amidotransferase